jgi:hypothetical protein
VRAVVIIPAVEAVRTAVEAAVRMTAVMRVNRWLHSQNQLLLAGSRWRERKRARWQQG